jgi:hypothetical protein
VAKPTPSASATRARRLHVDELHLTPGDAPRQPGHQTAHHAGAHHRHAVAHAQLGVPHAVDRRLQIARQHRARRRHPVGDRHHVVGRHHVFRLVRMQAEHRATGERPIEHPTDVQVPVLHRKRKGARLVRRAHALVLAGRHAPFEDKRLGAAADPAVERLHPDLARLRGRHRFFADLAHTRGHGPERTRHRPA